MVSSDQSVSAIYVIILFCGCVILLCGCVYDKYQRCHGCVVQHRDHTVALQWTLCFRRLPTPIFSTCTKDMCLALAFSL